jgi:hypothetical protein
MQAALKAQINKTDRNDARGIAQMMRVGLYRPVCACVDHQSRTMRALRLVVHPANAMPVMLPRKTSPHDEGHDAR